LVYFNLFASFSIHLVPLEMLLCSDYIFYELGPSINEKFYYYLMLILLLEGEEGRSTFPDLLISFFISS
jgi:hypothetical protein